MQNQAPCVYKDPLMCRSKPLHHAHELARGPRRPHQILAFKVGHSMIMAFQVGLDYEHDY